MHFNANNQEFEDAAARQDRGALADIERGLGELSQIAGAVGDALADQAVLAVAVEDKVAEASRGVKKSNVRMKGLLGQVSSLRRRREVGRETLFFSFPLTSSPRPLSKKKTSQLRTSRNFCLDATLFLILLALILYIYSVFAKR